ncbi:MAG: lysophospholipid acyltransferase family protein [Spirochaetota bacterium]|nr:lysophospholipid acyltransferase family protein [Spirochaetota bacterium]
MKKLFYIFLIALTKRLGVWIFRIISWFIASFYFFFFPSRVWISIHFFRALFPDRNFFYLIWSSWKQYHNFTSIFLDRFLLNDYGSISYTSEGLEYLEEAVSKGSGGIILMSHMGNWEIAASLLSQKGMKMLLYMGEKQKEQIEQTQKESLKQKGIKIIAVAENGGSPLDILDGIDFLKEGGLISITGDRIWRKDQRSISVRFLDHNIQIPETPHIFAMLSGAPLFVFFAFMSGKKQYRITISEPMYINKALRSERKQNIIDSAQKYADLMEQKVRIYPHQWYHFERFLGEKLT